jgi:energy-coupling factor transporter ATP-binding protein EcfA2
LVRVTTEREKRILRLWYATEFLEAFDVGNALRFGKVSGNVLLGEDLMPPWLDRRSLPADVNPDRLVYTAFLGIFSTSESDAAIRQLFPSNDERPNVGRTFDTCYASVRFDAGGVIDQQSLRLCTLPFALRYYRERGDARRGPGLNEAFRQHERQLEVVVERFAQQLVAHREPLTYDALRRLQNEIVRQTGGGIVPGTTDTRKEIGWLGKLSAGGDDDDAILGSFFATDIERIIDGARINTNVATYLSAQTPQRTSLWKSDQLRPHLRPGPLASGRWVENVAFNQSVMQQAALNLIRERLSGGEGILAINGPPGSGKTTLLRDFMATTIVDRAEQLTTFDDPTSAFTAIGRVPGEYPKTVYAPNPKITGFEMLVASSNNKAVENVSTELPLSKTRAPEFARIDYFARTASAVARVGDGQAWGLISAALGNSDNRNKISRALWFGDDGMLPFLRDEQQRTEGSLPWPDAVRSFQANLATVKKMVAQRSAWSKAVDEEASTLAGLRAMELGTPALLKAVDDMAADSNEAAGERDRAVERFTYAQRAFGVVAQRKPPFWMRVLGLIWKHPTLRAHERDLAAANSLVDSRELEVADARTDADGAEQRLRLVRARLQSHYSDLATAHEQLSAIRETMAQGRSALGAAFGGSEFWSRDDEAVQLSAPWSDKELNRARSQLFGAALDLHKAFASSARRQFRPMISLWVDVLQGKSPPLNDDQVLALWQVAFLLIPVMSTTFASVGTMLRRIDSNALGWLIIDEAGQASPQQALGTLWRTKRAIVVGDPLQIPPVVTLDDSIIERLRDFYDAEETWTPTEFCSVQTLADRMSAFGGCYATPSGEDVWVGCPLRVHRRCHPPMFQIANQIAYGGKMIYGTDESVDKALSRHLGDSRWFDVFGEAEGKHWVSKQGGTVLQLIERATALDGSAFPRLYVITPFRMVAYKLKPFLLANARRWAPQGTNRKQQQGWLDEHVGTVHTFQGREMDVVILVLGCDDEHRSAAVWASRKPNILNVAVTRAKHAIYVVGSRDLWEGLSHFSIAARHLPRV